MRRIEIGYLCRKGHYCFYADPEEDGACGAPGVGRIWLEIEPEWDDDAEAEERTDQIIWEADDSLAEKFEAWRAS
ncbi:hypothetical protein [Jiangella anatolica]|uniref:Uncharacterized protein n=1 Tax=Jiangella anatolica TaxID=2670374 RepID=A0A2W2B6Y7_9ACTN|nr:hypothetical protein [Jiangella anatolica]PZF83231.1 hypothetical protein C1I92_13215 [Jiangella anatolica]